MLCIGNDTLFGYHISPLLIALKSFQYYYEGIHGNDNTNVKIAAIEFRDFEVAAVSLNNVDSLEISDCNVVQNRHDVPIVGLFSAARFLR